MIATSPTPAAIAFAWSRLHLQDKCSLILILQPTLLPFFTIDFVKEANKD
jgi:hypothetical protein